MQKRIVLILLFLAFVAAIFWWWGSSGFPTQGQICEYTPSGYRDCAAYNMALVTVWHFLKFLNYISIALTALATIAVAYFTATIWRINREQLKHSHQVERAYMSAGGVPERHTVERFDGGTRVRFIELTGRFEVHVNNHGKTPGELMRIAIGFCDADNIPSQPIYDPQPFHDWIGPGTQSRVIDWRDIPTDRPATAVYGRIYYRDIFKRNQYSSFIQRILPDGGSVPLLAPPGYTASSLGRDQSSSERRAGKGE
jgi:hypothetical protein